MNTKQSLIEMGYKTALLVITFLVGSFASQESKIDFFLREDGISPRIVGGNTAPSQSHPHMVALTSGVLIRSFTCGGSLITRRTVLTAAHCIRDSMSGSTLSSNMRVRIGSNQWNSGTEFHLSRGIMHPNYNHANIKNDVAILITAINVPFNNNIQPITVNYSNVGGNVAVRVAGWGRTGANAPFSNNLLQVDLTTITGQDCVNRMQQATVNLGVRAPPVDPQIELCTLRATGFGTCNGDSGSALRRIDNGQQVGVVSWGLPCARGAPDIFVRVSAFRSFIESNTVT